MSQRPRTKPCAAPTVSVAGCVSVEFERQLLTQAAEHQLSLCQYVTRQLYYAASGQRESAELRRALGQHELCPYEREQEVARQQVVFAWYAGHMEQQLNGALKNLDCLRQLYAEYDAVPVSCKVPLALGFEPAYLLVSTLVDQKLCCGSGDYSWRYATKEQTHSLIFYHGNALR